MTPSSPPRPTRERLSSVDLTHWALGVDVYLADLRRAARARAGRPGPPARRPGRHAGRSAGAPVRPGAGPAAARRRARRPGGVPRSSAGSAQDTLLERKRQDAATLAGLLDSATAQTVLDAATARSVLGALNDLRLMLGTRLAMTEEGPAGRRSTTCVAYSTYDLLTALQYELVEVLADDRGGGGRDGCGPLAWSRARDRPGRRRRHRRPRPSGPPGRGLRRRRRPGGQRPPRAFRAHGERRSVTDLLRVRLDGPAAALPRDGRPRRGAGGHLPLAHRDRGLSRPGPTSRYASEPGAHYLLVSTRDPDTEEIRSFRIVDGVVTEEDVSIVPTLNDAPA